MWLVHCLFCKRAISVWVASVWRHAWHASICNLMSLGGIGVDVASPVSICMCVSFHCGLVSACVYCVAAHLVNLHTVSYVINPANSWHAVGCTVSGWWWDLGQNFDHIPASVLLVTRFCCSVFVLSWLSYYDPGCTCHPQGEWLLARRSLRVTRSTDVRLAAL